MDGRVPTDFLRHFSSIADPRAKNVIHRLSDMLTIAICAVICGAQGWVDVVEFGNSKLSWLKTFLDLPGGIPSHDTFGRLFARLDPDEFEHAFISWTTSLRSHGAKLLAIDGKSIRRSFEHAWDKSGMAHLVSAYVAANQLSFAQIACEGKGSELAAMRKLLGMIELPLGTVVSIDAGGCHKDIAATILEQQAEYVLAVKENQPTLLARIKSVLDEAVLTNFADLRHDRTESIDGDHGRIEARRVWVTSEIEHLGREVLDAWPGLASVALVESKREGVGTGSPPEVSRRYYISSIPDPDAKTMAGYIRGHWGIENKLHWQLDVSFGEDDRRIRKDHGAENFSRLCRITLNLLKLDTKTKLGIKAKRLKAGWNEPYLLKLLTG